MKKKISILPVLFVLLIISCGGDSEPDPETQKTTLDKLQGSWNITSVTVDGNDVTADFGGFAISINGSSYNLTNADGNAWPESSGSLGLGGDQATTMSMGSNSNIAVAFSNDDKTLTLSFTVTTTTLGGGRVSGLAGNYVFVFNKA